MDKILSDLVSNKVQSFLTLGLKRYVSLARFLRQITKSLLVLQIFFFGIQIGIILLISPLITISNFSNIEPSFWTPFLGGVIILMTGFALHYWNSERAWSRRLKISEAIDIVKSIDPK